MRKLLLGVAASLLLTGCVASHSVKREGSPITVADIPAARSFETISGVIRDSIRMRVYPNNISCLIAEHPTGKNFEVCFDEILLPKMMSALDKSIEWGNIAKTENVEIKKFIDYISNSMVVSNYGLSLEFVSINDGNVWGIVMEFSYYNAMENTNLSVGSYNSPKTTMILPEKSVRSLIGHFNNVNNYYAKAKNNKDKSHLFQ